VSIHSFARFEDRILRSSTSASSRHFRRGKLRKNALDLSKPAPRRGYGNKDPELLRHPAQSASNSSPSARCTRELRPDRSYEEQERSNQSDDGESVALRHQPTARRENRHLSIFRSLIRSRPRSDGLACLTPVVRVSQALPEVPTPRRIRWPGKRQERRLHEHVGQWPHFCGGVDEPRSNERICCRGGRGCQASRTNLVASAAKLRRKPLRCGTFRRRAKVIRNPISLDSAGST